MISDRLSFREITGNKSQWPD